MFFSKFNVNKVEWLNLVFENRNQSYGAYSLRLHSGEYLRNALIISLLFLGLLILIPTVYYRYKTKEIVTSPVIDLKPSEEIIYIMPVQPEIPKNKATPQSGSDLPISES